MTDEVTLLPCPFCGGEAAFGTVRYSDKTIAEQNWGQDTFHSVNCVVCGTNNRGPVGYRAKELAAEAWNRRSHLRTPRVEAGDDALRARVIEELRYIRNSLPGPATQAIVDDAIELLSRRPSEAVDGDGKCRGCLGSRTVRYTDAKASCGYRIEPCPDCAPSRRLTGAERRAVEAGAGAVLALARAHRASADASILDDADEIVATLRALADRLASEDGAAVEPTTHNQESGT